jgi:hypothetical protein
VRNAAAARSRLGDSASAAGSSTAASARSQCREAGLGSTRSTRSATRGIHKAPSRQGGARRDATSGSRHRLPRPVLGRRSGRAGFPHADGSLSRRRASASRSSCRRKRSWYPCAGGSGGCGVKGLAREQSSCPPNSLRPFRAAGEILGISNRMGARLRGSRTAPGDFRLREAAPTAHSS